MYCISICWDDTFSTDYSFSSTYHALPAARSVRTCWLASRTLPNGLSAEPSPNNTGLEFTCTVWTVSLVAMACIACMYTNVNDDSAMLVLIQLYTNLVQTVVPLRVPRREFPTSCCTHNIQCYKQVELTGLRPSNLLFTNEVCVIERRSCWICF